MANRRSCGFPAALCAACLTLVGCAGTGHSVSQTIRVETPGCMRASCELQNDRGHWHLASKPGKVTLTTSDTPLQVSCRAPEGIPNTVGAQASTRPMPEGGGLGGGLVGANAVGATLGTTALAFIPPLGIAALATGAAAGAIAERKLEGDARALTYPEQVTVPMSCPLVNDLAGAGMPPAALLGLQVRGLSSSEARSAGLDDRGAVLVIAVAEGGRAAGAGLHSGDIILGVDGVELSGANMLEDRARTAAGAPLALKLWREGRAQVLVLARSTGAP